MQQLPNGSGAILVAPGTAQGTLTNVSNPSHTLTVVVGGVGFYEPAPGDTTVVTLTGRNIIEGPQIGVVFAIGTFTFTEDAAGVILTPLTGNGRLVDLCALLE